MRPAMPLYTGVREHGLLVLRHGRSARKLTAMSASLSYGSLFDDARTVADSLHGAERHG